MTQKIRAGIIGAAGYTGGETLRLLLNHPHVEVLFAQSRSQAGMPVHTVHADLTGETHLQFCDEAPANADVVFLCMGHGESRQALQEHAFGNARIIDLSQDFRLATSAVSGDRTFVYGLPEINKAKIENAHNIANPGCFATAIQLALLPLAGAGLLTDVHITGITGSTGAGQKLQASSHFSWRHSNIEAYKSLDHQHVKEIRETLGSLQPQLPAVNFIPWRGDFTRGIYISAQAACTLSNDEAYNLYDQFYTSARFATVSRKMVNLKQVVNTNKCILHIETTGDHIVIHAAIDNLLKGAAGQAVQNMNIMFGLNEDAGLKLKATSF